MNEVEYLREKGLLVTSSRIEINGQLFAVRNVGSVKIARPRRPYLAAFVGLLALGAVVSRGPTLGKAFALLVLLAAGAWIWQQVKTRRLVIATTGGEVVALSSTSGALVNRVRDAVQLAISGR